MVKLSTATTTLTFLATTTTVSVTTFSIKKLHTWWVWLIFPVLFLLSSNRACKCIPPTLELSFQDRNIVIQALVLRDGNDHHHHQQQQQNEQEQLQRFYVARVTHVYKGCNIRVHQKVVLITPKFEAACGVVLTNQTEYLLTGDSHMNRHKQYHHILKEREVNSDKNRNRNSHRDGRNRDMVSISIGNCQFWSPIEALHTSQMDHLQNLQDNLDPCM